jgi:PAS domain S-box-containing protein
MIPLELGKLGETSMTGQPGESRRSFVPDASHQQADVLNIVLDSLTQGMVVVGPDYCILAFNRHFEELFQLPSGTTGVGVDFRDVLKTWAEVTGQDQQMLDHAILQLDNAAPFEFEFPQQIQGEPRWCLLTHHPLPGKGFVRTFTDITARKQAEEALRHSEAYFKAFFQVLPAGVLTHRQGLIQFVNPACLEMFGAKAAVELVGTPVMDRIHPEFRDKVRERIRTAMDRGLPGRLLEETFIRLDGSPFAVEATGHPINLDGQEAILVVFSDITERRRSEDALRISEERLRLALLATKQGWFDLNLKTGEVIASKEFAAIIGYETSGSPMTYQTWVDAIHRDDRGVVLQRFNECLTTGKIRQMEYRIMTRTGEWKWVRSSAKVVAFDGAGLPARMTGTHADITDRKQAEEALKHSEQDYRHLFEMANDPIIIFEPETELILEANQAACRTYGFDHDELVGLDLKSLTRDVLSGTSQIQKVMASGLYQNFETVQLNKQGEEIHFLINSSVITYRGRKAILSLNRDIGDRKRLEAQLQQSQKMESLGTLAGGVAHDMNNVLGAILGLASAHIGTQPYGSPLHQALDTICKATERGGKMVKSLLSFARQSPGEDKNLDLNAILKEQVSLLERTTMALVCLEMDLEPELRSIRGDASALAHAFMNLYVNAVDAMPERGTLTLRTRNVDNDWIEVVVEDNGMGMSKEVLKRAMEPFFTTKDTGKGTGLGLAMVFSTMNAHQGQLDIHSEPGKGTRVMLRFPASKNEAQASAATESEARPDSRMALRVLLVDDDELIQSSVQAILEVLGHTEVSSAQCGEEALGMLEAGLDPDLVILDMNMPGLGGAGTLPRLRGLRPLVPVLLSTGRTDQAALALASAHPGVTLLSKPFGLRELQKHLENIGLG